MTVEHEPGTCSWCGLPVASSWFWSRRPTADVPSRSEEAVPVAVVDGQAVDGQATEGQAVDVDDDGQATDDEFCCFGCRFASQVTQDRGESGQVQWTLTRLGIAIFCTMNVMVFTMALWSQDVYDVDR